MVVDAAHKDGGVAIIAHPGREDGFVTYDADVFDELRKVAPFDGIEAHYPVHTEAQTAKYLKYAKRHKLLVSSGSDSHGPSRLPIKYPARLSQNLLERVGIKLA
jgi:predicted metal-dependent phosphoesterase TrpH